MTEHSPHVQELSIEDTCIYSQLFGSQNTGIQTPMLWSYTLKNATWLFSHLAADGFFESVGNTVSSTADNQLMYTRYT